MVALLLLFLLCVVLSACFSGAESAITGLDNLKLQALIDEGDGGDIYRLAQTQRTRLITTLLVGNNVVNIGAAAIATSLFIQWLGGQAGPLAATAATTLIILVFAEIMPKSFAVGNPIPVFKTVIAPVYWMSIGLLPFVVSLEWLIQKLLRSFEVNSTSRQESVRDLEMLIDILGQRGQLDWQKRQLFRGALALDLLQAQDVAKPRVKMETISREQTLQDVIDLCLLTGYSRIPVQEDSKDEIVGIIHLKQALRALHDAGNGPLTQAMQPPVFVPSTKRIGPLLKIMLRSRQHLVIVVDEFGGTTGMLTLEDLLEELVGDIYDESDLSPLLLRRRVTS